MAPRGKEHVFLTLEDQCPVDVLTALRAAPTFPTEKQAGGMQVSPADPRLAGRTSADTSLRQNRAMVIVLVPLSQNARPLGRCARF